MATLTRPSLLALLAVIVPAASASAQPNGVLFITGGPTTTYVTTPTMVATPPIYSGLSMPAFGFDIQNIQGVGQQVINVQWGGRAAQLGIRPGDVILGVNGFGLTYPGSWNDALKQAIYNGGWAQLIIRDVQTGLVVQRTTYLGPAAAPVASYLPVTPYPPVASYPPIVTYSPVVTTSNPWIVKSSPVIYSSIGSPVVTYKFIK